MGGPDLAVTRVRRGHDVEAPPRLQQGDPAQLPVGSWQVPSQQLRHLYQYRQFAQSTAKVSQSQENRASWKLEWDLWQAENVYSYLE